MKKKEKEIRWRLYYITGEYGNGEIEFKDDKDKAYKLRALSRVLEILRGERTNEIR